MTGELSGGRFGLPDVVRLLREDITASETRVMTQITGIRAELGHDIEGASDAFLAYQSDHLGVHNRRAEDTDRIHKDLASRLDAMTIVEARRAGSLAVILLLIRTVGTHWQALAAIVALVGLLLGRVDISVSGPVP
jgi:hypothetical protein